jgi:hypothetical protein
LEAERNEQSRLESLGALADVVAHDFNNVLTDMVGNIVLADKALDVSKPNDMHYDVHLSVDSQVNFPLL